MLLIEIANGDIGTEISRITLVLLRLGLFVVALGLTMISFQAYSQNGSKQLEAAFVGFAFVSMGVAVSALNSQVGVTTRREPVLFYLLQIAETVPFLLGFGLLLVSLRR